VSHLTLVPDPETVGPEVAHRLDKSMRLLVGSISDSFARLLVVMEEAKRGNVHETLGFPSWTAYVADVFNVQIRLEPEQRRELVGYLSGEGMSQRAIAPIVGVDQKTVSNDLRSREENSSPEKITGLDNKTYPASKPKNAEPVADEPDDDPEPPEEDGPNLKALEDFADWAFFAANELEDAASDVDTAMSAAGRISNLDAVDADLAGYYIEKFDKCSEMFDAYLEEFGEKFDAFLKVYTKIKQAVEGAA
jgi:hypothetical protein